MAYLKPLPYSNSRQVRFLPKLSILLLLTDATLTPNDKWSPSVKPALPDTHVVSNSALIKAVNYNALF